MKIQFEISRTNRGKTPCPFGFIDGYEGKVKKVGTYACSDCAYFVSIDTDNYSIECDYCD